VGKNWYGDCLRGIELAAEISSKFKLNAGVYRSHEKSEIQMKTDGEEESVCGVKDAVLGRERVHAVIWSVFMRIFVIGLLSDGFRLGVIF